MSVLWRAWRERRPTDWKRCHATATGSLLQSLSQGPSPAAAAAGMAQQRNGFSKEVLLTAFAPVGVLHFAHLQSSLTRCSRTPIGTRTRGMCRASLDES